jgi:SAM-dependent methyltransferase
MTTATNQTLEQRYLSDEYVSCNPSYHEEHSEWKAALVAEILRANQLTPLSCCDVGCGAGKVLAALRPIYPQAELFGYDIAPSAAQFWAKHEDANIHFRVGNFHEDNDQVFDVALLMDVLEHLPDPNEFLRGMRHAAQHFVIHFPLDLSALTVLRESPILQVRRDVGHIHYYTKSLALALLEESGYEVMDWRYSGAGYTSPSRTWKSIVRSLPTRFAGRGKDAMVRLIGGETLIVLARAKRHIKK